MQQPDSNNPILNKPYEEPKLHYATDQDGALNYADVRKGRRIFDPNSEGRSMPVKQGPQKSMFEVNDFAEQYGTHLINLTRKEVGNWRKDGYEGTTRVTKELLEFWFNNPERSAVKKLFFAQREAIETAIWLNEVAGKSNAGQNILNRLSQAQIVGAQAELNLPRVAFKMATGTGKTVVMAALILYHFFNRQEYRNDTRYADNFLVVAPGITIKDRLGVLFVDTSTKDPQKIGDYYRMRGLVPGNLEKHLPNLNTKLVITNYHAFERRTLQGNKRSPFDGKIDAAGNKTEALEDINSVIKRVLSNFKTDSRLLILNDEAHHCYYPKAKGQSTEGEDTKEENARAAVWFTGITEISKKFKLQNVYDLSATPYYLSGSGYDPYSLFPWVVTDFGLIEAIESGLVKIPFLPETDNTQELSMPVLRNLYEHVKHELPRKGQTKQKQEAKKEGKKLVEAPPKLPSTVKSALEQFYQHYKDEFEGKNRMGKQLRLDEVPPVFIAVCNNTSVSKELYKYIAGYELTDEKGEVIDTVTGKFDLFSNFDPVTKRALRRPPTLLIDSDALENSEQIDDEFKKIFASEIVNFKNDYARLHGQGSVENLTDAHILREVVNTVGKKGALGSHIRCVVSVSMLTEGWDANTVTHIMGLRAFGSQLLCEQVAGRALRRKNYLLDKNGKFPPEYAHIIGIPFKMFKGGGGGGGPEDPQEYTHIFAIPERQEKYEITFPNLIGYRIENADDELSADFSSIENFEIDGSRFPLETIMTNAFSEDKEQLSVKSVTEKRDQELIYFITKELINYYYSDDERLPQFQKFNKLKKIVEEWYHTKIKLIGIRDLEYKKILYFFDPKQICDHIQRGVIAKQTEKSIILPVFNHYNKFGSTKYVNGNTSKEVYATKKSHVNYVVADTDTWEQIAAKTLEEIDEVESYVKNAFLGFAIPYTAEGKDRQYFPDFIARCATEDGRRINLIIEITGMNKDKALKKDYVNNRWLKAVNAVKDKYGYEEWHFIEVANDIRDIKNQLLNKIEFACKVESKNLLTNSN